MEANELVARLETRQIISKYPPEVVTKLEETKEPLRPCMEYKISEKAICHYATVQENVQCYVSSVNTNVKGRLFVPRQLTSDSYRPLGLPQTFCRPVNSKFTER